MSNCHQLYGRFQCLVLVDVELVDSSLVGIPVQLSISRSWNGSWWCFSLRYRASLMFQLHSIKVHHGCIGRLRCSLAGAIVEILLGESQGGTCMLLLVRLRRESLDGLTASSTEHLGEVGVGTATLQGQFTTTALVRLHCGGLKPLSTD